MSLLELLQSGNVEAFNAKRGKRAAIDLFGADLANLRLAGIDLSGANLEKADLTGCDLTEANLERAILVGADLTGAILDRAHLHQARMREAYIGEARAREADFSGADLHEADLTGLDATGARFVAARAKEAVFTNATLVGADFGEARLHDADLRGADMEGAILKGAELLRTNFGGARLVKADLSNARMAGAVLRQANLTDARLVEADLSGADLTGATLEGANFEKADLFDVQADPDALARARLPKGFATASEPDEPETSVDLHFEEPRAAVIPGWVAVLWENPEDEESVTLRVALCASGETWAVPALTIPVPSNQVLSRTILPMGDSFSCVVLLDRPGGVELTTVSLSADGKFGPPCSVRIGYAPVVEPVFMSDDTGVLLYGMGREKALSVHRWDGIALTELMRAPAMTYRGFCGKLEPVLLGKGGTVVAARPEGIGRLLTAPSGYPGRLHAAAIRADGNEVALAWTIREERGFRVQVVGRDTEIVRFDAQYDIGCLDIACVGERVIVAWTREGESTAPMAMWVGEGKPFRLAAATVIDDVDVLEFATGLGAPRLLLGSLGDEMVVVEVGNTDARVLARFGTLPPAPAPKRSTKKA